MDDLDVDGGLRLDPAMDTALQQSLKVQKRQDRQKFIVDYKPRVFCTL